MTDAAVGSKSFLARGIETAVGLRQGGLHFLPFISAEFSRDTKENPSVAITGSGGASKGTPGEIAFTGKLKYDVTVDRILMDLVGQYGAPASVTALERVASVTVGGSGSAYTNGSVVTFSGGGGTVQATGHVTTVTGNVTVLTVDTPGSGYTSTPTCAVADGSGNTFTPVMATDAWLVKIRPGAASPSPRALWTYLDEGGSYSANIQNARRPSEISLSEDANKRIVADVVYAEPTGDSISGFAIAKSTNTGLVTDFIQIAARGRRPYDADYTAGKSLYLKVTASDAQTVTLKAAFDTASGHTDGTGFPSTSFGGTTFVVRRPGSALAPDGYVTAVDSSSALPIGQFGQNNDPYEITFGDQDLSGLLANDVFEIPYQLAAGGVNKTSGIVTAIAENLLSAFHLIRKIGGADTRVSTGTVKWMRPFKPYYTNGRRLPQAIDPTGFIAAQHTFKKRLFDRAFRQKQESDARFTIEDVYRFQTPIAGDIYEGIHAFYPQEAVTTMKSGDVATKETLEESITLEAEQPDATPSVPDPLLGTHATFDASAQYVFQINVVTRNSAAFLA
jgi:hypothetical protein